MNTLKTMVTSIGAILVLQSATAQTAPGIAWQKSLGGTASESASAIQRTTDGGYIMAGSTSSNDVNVTGNHGASDAWIVKLNSTANIVWQKALGGSANDNAYAIQLTTDGGYIVAGQTNSNDGDVTGNHGSTDAWVIKLDSTGSIMWQRTRGGSDIDVALSIQQTTDGGYIMVGYSRSNNYDVASNQGSYDCWIVKLTTTGLIDWSRVIGGGNEDLATSVQQTADGGYIIAGYTRSNDGNITGNHGGNDFLIIKLNSSGNTQWQKLLGGTSNDAAYFIQQTTDGGYIVAGDVASNNGDVTGNHGQQDGWIVKLTDTGNIQWQKTIGGTTIDKASVIQQTTDGGYIVAGSTSSNDGDVTGNHGSSDYWIVKLDNTSNITWQRTLGGTGVESATAIQVINNVEYVVIGNANSNDGNIIENYGSQDIWAVKLAPCITTTNTLTVSACGSYLFNGNTLTQGGTYTDTLTTIGGCDSILTLNLTLHSIATTTVAQTVCGSFFFDNEMLTQSGTYYDTLTSANGCDSIVTLNLTIKNISETSLTNTACETYIFNGTALTVSGFYYDTLTNAVGCDSIVTLNLTITHNSASTQSVSACETYNFNGTILTQSGTFYDTISNVANCDSFITLNLTIKHNSIGAQTVSACDSYVFNGLTRTQSGTYYDTLQNTQGCDSIITLSLTIQHAQPTITRSGDTLSTGVFNSYQWLKDGNPISGATAQTYIATESGIYSVNVVDANSCSGISSAVSINIVSRITNVETTAFTVYPNPSNGNFVIASDIQEQGTIAVYDIKGAIVFTTNVASLEFINIDVSKQPKGIYIVKITNAQNTWTKRIVIE